MILLILKKIKIIPTIIGKGKRPRNIFINNFFKKNFLIINRLFPKPLLKTTSKIFKKINQKNIDYPILSEKFLKELAAFFNDNISKVEKLIQQKLEYKIHTD